MEQKFNKNSKVLISENIKNNLPYKRLKANFVIPVLLYKVSLPNLSNRELNFFQRTILNILHFKKIEPLELSEMLLLNVDLITYIINELESLEYYKNGVVTDNGKKALKNIYKSDDTIVGYFVYDLLCRRFIDYFILESELDSLQIEAFFNKGNDIVKLRTSLSDEYSSFIINDYDDTVNYEPSKEDIAEAYKNYIKNYKSNLDNRSYSMYDSEVVNYSIDIDKIQIFNEPIFYYLATYAYYNKSNINRGFAVSDPFFDNIDIYLKDFFEDNKNNGNINEIMKLVDEGIISYKDKTEVNNENNLEIENKMQNIFSIKFLENHKDFLDIGFGRLLDSYLKLKNSDSTYSDINQKYSKFIISLFDYFEYMFSYTMRNKIIKTMKLTNNINNNAEILTNIALDMGFINENNYIKYFLSRIQKERIVVQKKYAASNIQDLSTLVAINLLYASENADFNFNKLSDNFSNLFVFLFELKNIRNQLTHDGTYKIDLKNIDAYFYYFLGILTEMFNTKINYKELFEIKDTIKKDNFEEERREAEKIVIDKLGDDIKSYYYQDIYNSLVNMQFYFYANDNISKTISKIFEQLLKILIGSLDFDNVIYYVCNLGKNTSDFSFIDDIDDYLFGLGFTLEDRFPPWLKKRWKKKDYYISKEINNKYLFSDLIMFLIIYAQNNENGNNLLKNIANVETNFITYLMRYGNRQHNDLVGNKEIIFNYKSYKLSIDCTYLCVKTMLSVAKKNNFKEIRNG